MANLPSELVLDEIFPRLPSKSLLRFKSLSQFFKTLISSPNFINLHLQHSLISSANRLLIINPGLRYIWLQLFNLDAPHTRPEPVPFPDYIKPDPGNPILGSCNGLLLIKGIDFYDPRLLLINPCTRFYLELSFGNIYSSSYGFGYDNFINDYKVVAIDDSHVMIYSLKAKKWRYVDGFDENVIASIRGTRKDAIVIDNHLCHWLFWCNVRNNHRIVCFDLCTETWTQDVPLPDYNCLTAGSEMHFADHLFEECRDRRDDVTDFGIFDGRLTVMTDNTDVWVMKEYGVAKSWVKVFSNTEQQFTPLAYDRISNSIILCQRRGGQKAQLRWYNVKSKQSKKTEIHDVHGVDRFLEAYVFKGSLVTLPDGKRIPEDHQMD